MNTGMDLKKYFRNPNVRQRMIEYLGGTFLETATAVFIMPTELPYFQELRSDSPLRLDAYLEQGLDVSRSMWDNASLIAHLDLEYVNFDFAAEAYLDPVRTFALQHPVEQAVQRLLAGCGIAPLHLITGRGHHFVWRIDQQAAAFQSLRAIGRLPEHLKLCYARPSTAADHSISPELGAAFAGLALVMEYLAFEVQRASAKFCPIPIELSAVGVPPQMRGREIISIDISEYGDPLHTRIIRLPFGVYLKPWQRPNILNDEISAKIDPILTIPLHEMDVMQAIQIMRSRRETAELAAGTTAHIPDHSKAMDNLVALYRRSPLAEFHDLFYAEAQHPPQLWPQTYDRTPLDDLPPCIRHILEYPNDHLLKPAGIQQVVRALILRGWHPRHIAGLIRSKYERNYGWGKEWFVYDAATRADFYSRIFSAAVALGYDDLKAFNCGSVKGRQLCFYADGNCDLQELKQALSEAG